MAKKPKYRALEIGEKLPSGRIVSCGIPLFSMEAAYLVKRIPDLGYPKSSVVEYYDGRWYIGEPVNWQRQSSDWAKISPSLLSAF